MVSKKSKNMKEKIVQILQDASIQDDAFGSTYEDRIIIPSDFDSIAETIVGMLGKEQNDERSVATGDATSATAD